MSKVQVGKKVRDFKALLDNEETFKLSENKGKNIVFYFYPKDNTPGCTKEGEDFRDNYSVIKKLNTEVIGVSKDSVASHQKFIAKFNFPFNLISDENEKVCDLFNVIKEKNMYGRKYMGIQRSTFLINEKSKIEYIWEKVKVKGHAEDVINKIKSS